jgi:hypothetical protein
MACLRQYKAKSASMRAAFAAITSEYAERSIKRPALFLVH